MIAMHLRENESEATPGMTESALIDYYLREARTNTDEEKEAERDLVSRILRRLVSKDGVLVVVAGEGDDAEGTAERLLRVHPNFLPSTGM